MQYLFYPLGGDKCQEEEFMPKGIPRNPSLQQRILHRFNIARGHLNKVIRMTEQGNYCIDVIHQSLAVQSALKKANTLLLQNHMETCVKDFVRKGKTEEAIDEIVRVLEKTP